MQGYPETEANGSVCSRPQEGSDPLSWVLMQQIHETVIKIWKNKQREASNEISDSDPMNSLDSPEDEDTIKWWKTTDITPLALALSYKNSFVL